MLKNTAQYERDILQNSRPFIANFLLLHYQVFGGYCQRALVDELGVIGSQLGTHNRSVMAGVLGAPCALPPVIVTVIVRVNTIYIFS
jgi:hypothetical protein